MNQKEMEEALVFADKAMMEAKWEQIDPGKDKPDPSAKFYKGTPDSGESTGSWSFVVCSFDLENQGFPPGSRGYDGACTVASPDQNYILRMTRELAQKACELAETYLAEKRN